MIIYYDFQLEYNFSDGDLREMMSELRVDGNVNARDLKSAFMHEIRIHHTDKGGEIDKAQVIFHGAFYRMLNH